MCSKASDAETTTSGLHPELLGEIAMEHRIKGVYDENLIEFLETIGIRKLIDAGEMHCYSCGRRVTLDNISVVFPHDGEVGACCDNAVCLERLPRKVLTSWT